MTKKISRRGFIQSSVVAAAPAVLRSPRMGAAAIAEGPELRAGLVGCGARGTGAAGDFLNGSKNVKIVALADVFPDRLENARKAIAKKGNDVPATRCFTGFNAYKELIALPEVDIVLLATPPHFRPLHFAAA